MPYQTSKVIISKPRITVYLCTCLTITVFFPEFILTSEVTFGCTNIFSTDVTDQMSEIRSIRANVCVMLFSGHHCLGRSTKVQPSGTNELNHHWESTVTGLETLSLLHKSFPGWIWTTKSFYSCSGYEEYERLNVEITEFHINLNAPLIVPKVFNTYKSVCDCYDIPQDVRNLEPWSVNNHDTSMLVYFEQS